MPSLRSQRVHTGPHLGTLSYVSLSVASRGCRSTACPAETAMPAGSSPAPESCSTCGSATQAAAQTCPASCSCTHRWALRGGGGREGEEKGGRGGAVAPGHAQMHTHVHVCLVVRLEVPWNHGVCCILGQSEFKSIVDLQPQ
eukprot:366126-Chlamydomonas_euryale.AAC.1